MAHPTYGPEWSDEQGLALEHQTIPGGNPIFGQSMNRAAYKWRDLAERRRAHFVELFTSGRWRHYYDERSFFAALREAAEAADRWAVLAPLPGDDPADEAFDTEPSTNGPLQKTAA